MSVYVNITVAETFRDLGLKNPSKIGPGQKTQFSAKSVFGNGLSDKGGGGYPLFR